LCVGFSLLGVACSQGERPPAGEVDCSVLERYEFLNISDFAGTESGWFRYADPTPGGAPNPDVEGSNVPVLELEPPRCGDNRYIMLAASGKNFWGAGFGDWQHNQRTNRAPDGTDYEGISFWARSPMHLEKTFMFNVDDGHTIINAPPLPTLPECADAGPAAAECELERERIQEEIDRCGGLPPVTGGEGERDLDGDGCIGPGDFASGTECRLPPSSSLGTAQCYNGDVTSPPSGGSRVPVSNECGNAFHTRITTSSIWQLFTIPWSELVQWPCPNRLEGGIDRADIRKFEIKFVQGTNYELWLDNIKFYRRL
jgi:hypothetical protein